MIRPASRGWASKVDQCCKRVTMSIINTSQACWTSVVFGLLPVRLAGHTSSCVTDTPAGACTQTSWGSYNLTEAALLMMRRALEDPLVQYFAVLSDTGVRRFVSAMQTSPLSA